MWKKNDKEMQISSMDKIQLLGIDFQGCHFDNHVLNEYFKELDNMITDIWANENIYNHVNLKGEFGFTVTVSEIDSEEE